MEEEGEMEVWPAEVEVEDEQDRGVRLTTKLNDPEEPSEEESNVITVNCHEDVGNIVKILNQKLPQHFSKL